MTTKIPFNQSGPVGREMEYVSAAITSGETSGNGKFSKRCEELMQDVFSARRVFLTPSCTAALEMGSVLCDLRAGDEVLLPSFTFVSTANALILRGVRPRFVDIRPDTKNIDESLITEAITEKTKAIVPVHYAGVGCNMNEINRIAAENGLFVMEDAAQGVNARINGASLGTIGNLGAYSFHSTKNYSCGEGGALLVNDESMVERAEIVQEKGTNRRKFMRGQVDKYTWVDVGSSYLLSEILAAHLYGQLEQLDRVNADRQRIYNSYYELMKPLAERGLVELPIIPDDCQSNYHMFYMLTADQSSRDGLLQHLRDAGIIAAFHYVPLHSSPMGERFECSNLDLPVTNRVSAQLLRLPFYYGLGESEIEAVTTSISGYFHL